MCYKQKCKVVSLNLAHPVHVGSVPGLLFINFSVSKLTQKITRNLMLYQVNAPALTRYYFLNIIFGSHNLQTFPHNTLINKLLLMQVYLFCLKVHHGIGKNYASHCLSTEETYTHALFLVCSLKVMLTSKPIWKLKNTNSILKYFEYFCQMSSKLILIISSYTVSNIIQSWCVFSETHSINVTYMGKRLHIVFM